MTLKGKNIHEELKVPRKKRDHVERSGMVDATLRGIQ